MALQTQTAGQTADRKTYTTLTQVVGSDQYLKIGIKKGHSVPSGQFVVKCIVKDDKVFIINQSLNIATAHDLKWFRNEKFPTRKGGFLVLEVVPETTPDVNEVLASEIEYI